MKNIVSCGFDNVTVSFVVAHFRALQTKLTVYFFHLEGKEEKCVCVCESACECVCISASEMVALIMREEKAGSTPTSQSKYKIE